MYNLAEIGSNQQGHFAYHNLPTQPTPLVGRGREVEALLSMLRRPDVRLLTLTGPPGIGKTRLALQVAGSASHSGLLNYPALGGSELPIGQAFPDGVCFVPLAPISDPDLVLSAIAQALELRGVSDRSLLDSLKIYLQTRQMLLLLDNFEQVVTAAPLLADLLAACPHVKLLVTSRELLNLYGEQDYPVPPLEVPGLKPALGRSEGSQVSSRGRDSSTLETGDLGLETVDIEKYEAVELFVRRAQAVKPGFELTDRNAPAIAEICLRLDGLPLAIELAAARILVLQPEELLERLKSRLVSRLKLLTGGARNLPERQRTLQAAIDWSYNLLDPAEQALFRRLGVFLGGCTLEAIEVVCGGEPGVDALDGVTSLVGKSLISVREGPQAEYGAAKGQAPETALGEPRFLLLETIREYARHRLEESGELESTRDRHLDYFVRFAETAEQGTRGNEQPLWMRRIDAELNNLRAALEWSLSREGQTEKGLRVVGALGRYWQSRGYLSEGRHWCTQLLTVTEPRPEGARPSVERARALRTLARMIFEQGDFMEARPIYEQSLEMSRALGDDWGVASSLSGLGPVALWLGEYDLSLSLIQEALAVWRRLGDRQAISSTLVLTGTILMLKEDYRAAQLPLEEALAIDRDMGFDLGIANALAEHGAVAFHLGEYGKARELLEESLGISRALGVDWITAKCLARLGVMALRQGDARLAEALSLDGLARFPHSGNKRWTRWYLVGLAEVARLRGMVRRAAKLIGASEGTISAAGGHYEPGMRAEVERIIANVRAELDGETFTTLSAEGRAMPAEEVLAYALEPIAEEIREPGQVGALPEGQRPYPDDLTEREVEVLRLIAVGKSNQEIAQELVLSLRTVERHISNIYQKIGATGRVARATVTAYALRHGLTE